MFRCGHQKNRGSPIQWGWEAQGVDGSKLGRRVKIYGTSLLCNLSKQSFRWGKMRDGVRIDVLPFASIATMNFVCPDSDCVITKQPGNQALETVVFLPVTNICKDGQEQYR